MENRCDPIESMDTFDVELDVLLHPAKAFTHPRAVVVDGSLSLDEKRAILASWASDACAVEAAPALRRAPGSANIATVDEILEALRDLDLRSHDEKQGRAAPGSSERRRADIPACGPVVHKLGMPLVQSQERNQQA
jgi:hypothetical protein